MSIRENMDDTTSVSSSSENVDKAAGTRQLANLVIGDILVFLVFSVIGRISHGEPVGLTALPQVVGTAAPFAAGWFIVAPFVGPTAVTSQSSPARWRSEWPSPGCLPARWGSRCAASSSIVACRRSASPSSPCCLS